MSRARVEEHAQTARISLVQYNCNTAWQETLCRKDETTRLLTICPLATPRRSFLLGLPLQPGTQDTSITVYSFTPEYVDNMCRTVYKGCKTFRRYAIRERTFFMSGKV